MIPSKYVLGDEGLRRVGKENGDAGWEEVR
jgi:hypothetical protein